MKEMKIYVTNSYYNVFNVFKNVIKNKSNGLDDRTLIFCDEKKSLMLETALCEEKVGSFSSQVYSFGNYTRLKMQNSEVLSKEASIMAITKLLKIAKLSCFKDSKTKIASSIYDLIVQLKSSKIGEEDIIKAINGLSEGILKNKLVDIKEIFKIYEDFIKQENYKDQSSVISLLKDIIKNDNEIEKTDIYLVGYTSLTQQALDAVEEMLKKAKSVTAILTGGSNTFAFVNEVENMLINACAKLKINANRIEVKTEYNSDNQRIIDNIFEPQVFKLEEKDAIKTENIYKINASDEIEEFEKVATIIKALVIKNGNRYSDFTIAVSDSEKIKYTAKKIFNRFEIPYFLDVKKSGSETALVKLILAYIEVLRHNLERGYVTAFLNNPLVISDNEVCDRFENYLLKYNINYNRFKEPFTFKEGDEDIDLFNSIREKIVDIFSCFNVRKMLDKLNIVNGQEILTERLNSFNYTEEASINEQIYDAVIEIINSIEKLCGKDISILEFKELFISGVSALKLSILPQHKDAVFIGNYKEAGVLQNKYVFALELNSDVPNIINDVSILSDSDINCLKSNENISIKIEPTVGILNHRSRENLAMVLSAFKNKLIICCPNTNKSGKKNIKSEVFSCLEKLFIIQTLEYRDRFLTEKQGVLSFAKDVSLLRKNKLGDFSEARNFYSALNDNDTLKRIATKDEKPIKDKVKLQNHPLINDTTSASLIESYASCPYKAFMENFLKVKERDDGEVSSLTIGNLLHLVFKKYIESIDKINDTFSSDMLVDSIFQDIFKLDIYAKFLKEEKNASFVNRAKVEAKKFCMQILTQFNASSFNSVYLEKKFNSEEKGDLPPVKLLNGEVKVVGKIDRVDGNESAVRIIDYKTGNAENDRQELFNGTKIQLFLYANVLKDKEIAGVYYMPISNEYNDKPLVNMFVGDSLLDEDILKMQDGEFKTHINKILPVRVQKGKETKEEKINNVLTKEQFKAMADYSIKISENISKNMKEGFIPASPLCNNERYNVCGYCKFKGMCNDHFTVERSNDEVTNETIVEAIKKGEK